MPIRILLMFLPKFPVDNDSHVMETLSALLALCKENPPVTDDSP